MTLVDTNVLIDVLRGDQEWKTWSENALEAASRQGEIIANPVIYAELSSQYDRIASLDAALRDLGIKVVEIPRPALFLAGHAFKRYRRKDGGKSNVLPDFFIGAHAAVSGTTLLTRDAKRVRSYFPTVTLICPD